MKFVVPAVLASVALSTGCAWAVTFAPTMHSEFQAVYDDGTAAWPSSGSAGPIQMTGVVINNPWDMLDYGNSAGQPQWQVMIQAVDAGDFGGSTLYMRKHIPWDSGQDYTDGEWTDEMLRVNYPGDPSQSQPALRYGDVIQVQALAPGLFYEGKYNINEQHQKSSGYDFSITILSRNATPAAANISLSTLKDASDNFIFDETRQTGDERYQGSLVRIDNLKLLDPADWSLGGTVMVEQGGLTFPMLLGLDPALASINVSDLQTIPFSVTAILDQEDSAAPFTNGYRLWLTSASNLAVPEPGSLALAVVAALVGLLAWNRKNQPAAE